MDLEFMADQVKRSCQEFKIGLAGYFTFLFPDAKVLRKAYEQFAVFLIILLREMVDASRATLDEIQLLDIHSGVDVAGKRSIDSSNDERECKDWPAGGKIS